MQDYSLFSALYVYRLACSVHAMEPLAYAKPNVRHARDNDQVRSELKQLID